MKKNKLFNIYATKLQSILFAVISITFFSGCDNDDPKKEDTPELITKVTLTYTPTDGGSAVVVTATDPDGEGVQDIAVDGPINLAPNKTYLLTIGLINTLVDPSKPEYNIAGEVKDEADEHMFFFEWSNNVFIDPAGNGNIDNRSDDVNYEDEDGKWLTTGA
jgi:hypothetical protein